jgi:hypothetical protein
MPREDCNSVPGVSNRSASRWQAIDGTHPVASRLPGPVVLAHVLLAVTTLTPVVLAMLGVGAN